MQELFLLIFIFEVVYEIPLDVEGDINIDEFKKISQTLREIYKGYYERDS